MLKVHILATCSHCGGEAYLLGGKAVMRSLLPSLFGMAPVYPVHFPAICGSLFRFE